MPGTQVLQYGEGANLRATFRTPATAVPPKELIDPTVVTLQIRKPDKTVVELTYGVDSIIRDSVGQYRYTLPLDQEGTYHWRWRGANGIEAGVKVGYFDSRREPNL